MAVWIGRIMMSDEYKLCVSDAHQFHILPCNFSHHLVRQFVLILRLETQCDMSNRL